MEKEGYKLAYGEEENSFSYHLFSLSDPKTRPIPSNPTFNNNALVPVTKDRFAFITESKTIAVIDLEYFSYIQEIGSVQSICRNDSTSINSDGDERIGLLALTEVDGMGRLFLLNEDGDILTNKSRAEPYYDFPSDVILLSAFNNQIIFFKDIEEDYYLIDLINGTMARVDLMKKDTLLKWHRFLSVNILRICFFIDGEYEWCDLKISSGIDHQMAIEVCEVGIVGKFLGCDYDSIIVSKGNDALVLNPVTNIEKGLLRYINYVASSKTNRVFTTITDSCVCIVTQDNVLFYQRHLDSLVGKQWIKELANTALGFFSSGNVLFILHSDCLEKIETLI